MYLKYIAMIHDYFAKKRLPWTDKGREKYPFSFLGHRSRTRRIHMMKDGQHFITVCFHTIKYWEKESGKHIATFFLGNPNPEIAVVDDDRTIITANDKKVSSIDIPTGVVHTLLSVDESVYRIEFFLSSSDGSTVFLHTKKELYGYDEAINQLERWDTRTGQMTHHIPLSYEHAKIALSPDNQILLVQEEFQVTKWNSADLTLLGQLYQCNIEKNERLVGIAFFPTSQNIVVFAAKFMYILDYEGAIKKAVGFGNGFWNLKFSKDERFLGLAIGDHYIFVVDLIKMAPILTKSYSNFIWDICFTPDGKQVGAVGMFPPVFYDLEKGKIIKYYDGIVGAMHKVYYSPNGMYLLMVTEVSEKNHSSYTILEICNIFEGKPRKLGVFDRGAWLLNMTNTHALIRKPSDILIVLDLETGKVTTNIEILNNGVYVKPKDGLLSPKGTRMFLKNDDNEFQIYDWTIHKTLDLLPDIKWYDTVTISPSGNFILIYGEWDLTIYSLPERKIVFSVNNAEIDEALNIEDFRCGCFCNADDTLVIVGTNGSVLCIDWRARKVKHQFKIDRFEYCESVVFSPCNNFLLANCSNSVSYVWSLPQNGLVWKRNGDNNSSTEHFSFNEVLGVWKWEDIALFTEKNPHGDSIQRPISGLEVLENGLIDGEVSLYWPMV